MHAFLWSRLGHSESPGDDPACPVPLNGSCKYMAFRAIVEVGGSYGTDDTRNGFSSPICAKFQVDRRHVRSPVMALNFWHYGLRTGFGTNFQGFIGVWRTSPGLRQKYPFGTLSKI
jgi:hypothetical protein